MAGKRTKAPTQQQPSPALKRLDVLVGEWEIEVSKEGQALARTKSAVEWLEGEEFLIQHANAEPPLPSTPPEWVTHAPQRVTAIMGLDDTSEKFTMLYADSRGVFRVYQMSLRDGVWKLWREAPGFSQRFEGRFSADGKTITAHWDFSSDGSTWERDFDMTYTKLR